MADVASVAQISVQPSPDGTSVQAGGSLIDFNGNRYTIISGRTASGGNILVNDRDIGNDSAVLLVFAHSLIFELTNTNVWNVVDKSDFLSRWKPVSGDPRGVSPPLTKEGASPELASVTSGGTLTDFQGNKWQLTGGSVLVNGHSPISFNGLPSSPTNAVDMLVYANSLIVAHTTSNTSPWQLWLGNPAEGAWYPLTGDPRGGGAIPTPTPMPPPPDSFMSILDTSTGKPLSDTSHPYTGPVAGLLHEYINITADSLNITATTDNWFIHSGAGTDAISAHGGTNVLDGGTGSNFLTGGSGTDTFFVDARSAAVDIWSTMVNFHAGDAATVWGISVADFTIQWPDGQGAVGFTGLTLHATNPVKPVASLTLVGFLSADMANGRLSTVFGTDAASGSSFLYIHANF